MNFSRATIAADISTGNGAARIMATHPSAEIRALTPSVERAYADFETQNAKAKPLQASRSALTKELANLRGSRRPTEIFDEAREAELVREIAKLDDALRRNEQAAKKLAIDYLLEVLNNPNKDKATQHAAKLALEAHDEAVAALAKLEDALKRRERFYASAGSPGKWKHYKTQMETQVANGQVQHAHQLIAHKVAAFPTEELDIVSKGGHVMTDTERKRMVEKQAKEAAAKAAASARERDRRQTAAMMDSINRRER